MSLDSNGDACHGYAVLHALRVYAGLPHAVPTHHGPHNLRSIMVACLHAQHDLGMWSNMALTLVKL